MRPWNIKFDDARREVDWSRIMLRYFQVPTHILATINISRKRQTSDTGPCIRFRGIVPSTEFDLNWFGVMMPRRRMIGQG